MIEFFGRAPASRVGLSACIFAFVSCKTVSTVSIKNDFENAKDIATIPHAISTSPNYGPRVHGHRVVLSERSPNYGPRVFTSLRASGLSADRPIQVG